VFERFTARARRVLVLAQEYAQQRGHHFIGTEHMLIGLIAEGEGVGAKVLSSYGLSRPDIEAKVAAAGGPGPAPGTGVRRPPFTAGAKKVLECSLREALELGHNYIGTEHLLLGLLREADGIAAHVLVGSGVTLPDARTRVLEALKDDRQQAGFGLPRRLSTATREAVGHAAALAKDQPLTTGQLLTGVLTVTTSHAARALAALGVTKEVVDAELSAIPLESTSDSAPRPRTVEIRLGQASTVIADPELAAALQDATPQELQQVLRQLVRDRQQRGDPGESPP
jgi:ATP-dependent Clp protease ATP-binding subunit ClpC